MKKSPNAPDHFPNLPEIPGVLLSSFESGIKYKNQTDLMLATFDPGTTVAGVLTQSLTASAAVIKCRQNLVAGEARALIVNSGNANAFTGVKGEQHCSDINEAASKNLACPEAEVFCASTGVIGEPLPVERVVSSIPGLVKNLKANNWQNAANAITTTDTFDKGVSIRTEIDGRAITINGFAKGSGMIAPDMATMLAFLFTDARIPAKMLQQMLVEANETTFNAITVDSDTSTSDTCLLFATGQAANPVPDSINHGSLSQFRFALKTAMLDLAKQVVRDGEGATKLVSVKVTGAESQSAAKVIAKSIANSPLVKTAIAGEDANWGRIVMAVGKSGEKASRDSLEIKMGGIPITRHGQVIDGYDESKVSEHLKQSEISIEVDVGIGSDAFTVWTCDLTHGYIDINADYRS